MIALSSYLKTRIALMSGRMTSLSAQSSAPARRVESGKWPWICSKRCLRRKMLHHAAFGSYSINSILYSMLLQNTSDNKVLLAWMVQVAAFFHARLRWLWAQWRWAPRSRPVKGWDNGSWRYISSSRALASAVLGSRESPWNQGQISTPWVNSWPWHTMAYHGIPWHTMAYHGPRWESGRHFGELCHSRSRKGWPLGFGQWPQLNGHLLGKMRNQCVKGYHGLPYFGHIWTPYLWNFFHWYNHWGPGTSWRVWAEEAKENGVWAAFWEKESGNVGPAA